MSNSLFPSRTALTALATAGVLAAAASMPARAAQQRQGSKMRPTAEAPANPESALGFNSLRSIAIDPQTGKVDLLGSSVDGGPRPIPYEQVLMEALAQPGPQFSLESDFSRFTRQSLAGRSLSDMLFTDRNAMTRFARVTLDVLKVPQPRTPDRVGYIVAVLRQAGFSLAADLQEAVQDMDGAFQVSETMQRWIEIVDLVPAFRAFRAADPDGADSGAADVFYLQLLRRLDDSLVDHGNDAPSLYRQLRGAGTNPDLALRHGVQAFLESYDALMVAALEILLERHGLPAVIYSSEDLRQAFGVTPVSHPRFVNLNGTTQLARLLFEGDYALKSVPFATSLLKVPGYETLPAWAEAYIDRSALGSSRDNRYWITVDSVGLRESADGNLATIDSVRLRVESRTKALDEPWSAERIDPVTKAYADLLTERFDEIAGFMPELYNLREVAKVISLANWLAGKGVRPDLGVTPVPWEAPDEVGGFLAMMPYLRDGAVVWGTWPSGGVDFDFRSRITVEKDPGLTSDSVRGEPEEPDPEEERRNRLLGPVDVRGLVSPRSQLKRAEVQARIEEIERVWRLSQQIQKVPDAVGLLNRFLLETQKLQAGALREAGTVLSQAAERLVSLNAEIDTLPAARRDAVRRGLGPDLPDPASLRDQAAGVHDQLKTLAPAGYAAFDPARIRTLAEAGSGPELKTVALGIEAWDAALADLEGSDAETYAALSDACRALLPFIQAAGHGAAALRMYGTRTALVGELVPNLGRAADTLASLTSIVSRQLDVLEADRRALDDLRG